MEFGKSIIEEFTDIERQVQTILNLYEVEEYSVRKMKQSIVRLFEITRKLLHDFETEEDVKASSIILTNSEEHLRLIRDKILDSSLYNVFSPVDVAQITAKIDQLNERLI